MKANSTFSAWTAILVAGAAAFATGCAAFRSRTAEVDVDEKRHMGADYDYTDMRTVSASVVDELVASPFMQKESEPPVMMIAGVQNRTSQYVDTKNLTDRVRSMLFQSGRVRFVNETRREELLKEQGYEAANATPETQVAVGRQLGAKYMMSGSLTEMKDESPRQVRVSKTQVNYYKLTYEVTDLTSGEIVWMTEKEFAREARLPLIGW
jgi:uncharacterized protein (TIGR02722 family)